MDSNSLILGLVQGLTEFLPVSSSGHLGLTRAIIGSEGPVLAYDLILHIATLLAVVIYFATDIFYLLAEWIYGFFNKNARSWVGWRFGWAVIAGSAITAPLGVLLKPYSEAASVNLMWLGGDFWITAILLASVRFINVREGNLKLSNGAFVGLMQGIAVMPGISRSGATIWAGMVTGLSRGEAFRFSFLLSVPAIIGAALYEGRDLGGYGAFAAALPDGWVTGAVAAFLAGMISLILLRRLVMSEKWWILSVYCMLLGTVSVIFSIMGG
ncbi:MAG: undecaprenyl-diphosphate phosphatase [Synergistaceae bacterium]|jgi:undecaprenyl-diphosphatase|nr:undecaprenyl-diphosphate phosphatase [Synergistaceae bacterium]